MRHCLLLGFVFAALLSANDAHAACCYFSAKNADILQPAQKVFITWDPAEKVETFTVQPKFEGNALDFGMVIPTPNQPKLSEMPRDFFKHLAVYSIMKKREMPRSKLFPQLTSGGVLYSLGRKVPEVAAQITRQSSIVVRESGVVGSLDYKIIEAGRADDLYQWLKDNKYHYAGDEATLHHYVQKKWLFTVMKIDTMQMKRNKDGTFDGEVTPTRFRFSSQRLVYPLKITQISVRARTEALFYVQAPYKVDLPDDFTYQYTWVPMLQGAIGCSGGIPGGGQAWLDSFKQQIPRFLARGSDLGFNFVAGQRPMPNSKGHIPTTMEWARKLTKDDIAILMGKYTYTETAPNLDDGFTEADVKDPMRKEAIYKVVLDRLANSQRQRPNGYLVREAPADDVKDLQKLAGHLSEGLFITKFRKTFARDEMNDDLLIVPARYRDVVDESEYEEMLPSSPP